MEQRLFLPEAWLTEAYAARRTRCNGPQERAFQRTPQLAAAMLQGSAHEGLLPFTSLVAECLYGHSPDCLDAVDACGGGTALGAIPAETRCGLHRPQTKDRPYTDQGEGRSKRVVVAPDNPSCTVAALAARLPSSRWYRRTVSAGTKGPLTSAVARQRVTLCKEGLPERTVWLWIKRTLGADPPDSYAISHAPASTP